MSKKLEVVRGSRNVFRDFGLLDADVRQLKAILAAETIKALDLEGEEIKGHFDGVAAGLRQGLKQHVAEQVGGLREEMGGLRNELRAEMAEVRRHAGALADDLRSEIRMVADGVALANERIDHLDLRVDSLTGEVRRGFAGVRAEIHSLHETDDELRRRIEAQEQRGA